MTGPGVGANCHFIDTLAALWSDGQARQAETS